MMYMLWHVLTSCYRQTNKRKDVHMIEGARDSFTPLVFSASGRMGPATWVFLQEAGLHDCI